MSRDSREQGSGCLVTVPTLAYATDNHVNAVSCLYLDTVLQSPTIIPRLLPRKTGREPGRFDHVHHDVACMVLCVVLIIELLSTQSGSKHFPAVKYMYILDH